MVKIYAPASIGNVGVAFDVLGAAVTPVDGSLLGDCLSVEASPHFSLTVTGPYAQRLPQDPSQNLAWLCWEGFCQELGRPVPVAMNLEKNMPLCSGLGSSASTVVAALDALNRYCGRPLDDHRLLDLMGRMEGTFSGGVHYDNVAPSYLGGLQLILQEPGRLCLNLPCPEDWYWVMAYADISVPTALARSVMPQSYSRGDCVRQGRNIAAFVHSCYSGDSALAGQVWQDLIAEPYRAKLLPGFDQARETVMALGALTCQISGSGPTLFVICQSLDRAQACADALAQGYSADGFVKICRLDREGSREVD